LLNALVLLSYNIFAHIFRPRALWTS